MAGGDVGIGLEQILSEQEIAAIKFAQDVYGARAKQAAVGLAEILELDPKSTKRFCGGVALRLEGLDFEDRRRVALGFQELSAVLGGTAVREGRPDTLDLGLVAADVKEDDSTPKDHAIDSARPNGKASIGENAKPPTSSSSAENIEFANVQPDANAEAATQKAPPLTPQQRSWFARLYDEADVQRIEDLSQDQRAEFVKALASRYTRLKITRLNPAAKHQRAQQLTALMSGNTYREIADELGIKEGTLKMGLTTMTKSIKSRMTKAQLVKLISAQQETKTSSLLGSDDQQSGRVEAGVSAPTYGEPKELAAEKSTLGSKREETSSKEVLIGSPLNPQQRSWLSRFYDEASITKIEQISGDERQNFVLALAGGYKNLRIKSLTPEAKQQRAEQIIAFMGEGSISEVAEQFGVKPYLLQNVLDRIADNITNKVPRTELLELIPEPAKSPEALADAATVAASTAETNSDKTEDLSKIQKRWYGKVFEDEEEIETIQSLTRDQRAHLAKRLGQRLNPAVLHSQGPVKTARRLDQVRLLIDGQSYQEIAEALGLDIATVKLELHHSATRLKSTTPPSALMSILKEAKLHQAE